MASATALNAITAGTKPTREMARRSPVGLDTACAGGAKRAMQVDNLEQGKRNAKHCQESSFGKTEDALGCRHKLLAAVKAQGPDTTNFNSDLLKHQLELNIELERVKPGVLEERLRIRATTSRKGNGNQGSAKRTQQFQTKPLQFIT